VGRPPAQGWSVLTGRPTPLCSYYYAEPPFFGRLTFFQGALRRKPCHRTKFPRLIGSSDHHAGPEWGSELKLASGRDVPDTNSRVHPQKRTLNRLTTGEAVWHLVAMLARFQRKPSQMSSLQFWFRFLASASRSWATCWSRIVPEPTVNIGGIGAPDMRVCCARSGRWRFI